ncbi:hybrid sensor histidine kinase/response regulator transcription factor [Bacillus tropicus]|uniref:hybrid sensor histidine kinase/response regulator transcription factor n=1 Tax=Bacillus tropicus TaxID=2026188 RepID=UPI002DBCD33C|nr:hybrid sensor histidine kinase/response regulator transcription factor [Bacillus tropicus]MEC2921226.1 hybrid sensor histidine kinase/response regulator transcription factor [Bacillus tropicus]MEC2927435.1 hybrid sensor histidine kinase/response regulator transcription factor [Bacillus tropicus]MEC2957081.1 hybrid sensor histidine kinase/response regulator transcription factor [Bacillus tropicus]MEC3052295.1 hybrid sensor histidine kinase/response regulator transcription factor [Bacillus tro
MFKTLKLWFWYDWALLCIRFIVWLSLISTTIQQQDHLTVPLWIIILWEIVSFSVPWICLMFSYRYYLFTEIILFGGVCFYLTLLFPSAYLTFLMPTFMIAANSAHKSYRWSGPITIILFPLLIAIFSKVADLWGIILQLSLAFAMGSFFRLLAINYRQSETIRNQKHVLEQYVSQVERITLLEERDRLSKDLHDTMGHSYTSIIMGMETLRMELKSKEGEQQLDSLLQLARNSMEEVRLYLHQLDLSKESLPLAVTLQQLTEEFKKHAKVKVRTQIIGEEYVTSKQSKMTLYRTLQESLTNAVRHGHSTEIIVSLHFEPQQIRLDVQDNGCGVEEWKDGFGLTAMKERVSQSQGRVIVYSKKGEGTLISCVLPKQVQLSNEQIRLCIVDDHSFIRESLHTLLDGQEDLQVVGMAEDGERALELCERLKPDIVLMDLEMPNMDGINATKMIKKKWPDMRVLILSTFQSTERAKEIIRNGADGYLLKSIDSRELAESIRLVYRGGTMINHDLFHRMWEDKEETGLVESRLDGIEYGLTKRELEILELLSQGSRYKTIASTLYLSNGTVRNYASNLYEKLGVKNREEAVQKAKDKGLLS